ncbi:response regulator transcription factor [Modicisalibacter luteus]|uniref:LuxR C-terminal-related transcriptional regulator n=1 Tax=Modicisalibacter luteus TaxID=453962 RepID=A0ABV7M414_9GAMM|nr:response regulator transcription factor [Halomonas lutea]GHA90893.1 hypothetical protein GCM10007159_10290 [Halomonas lutea]
MWLLTEEEGWVDMVARLSKRGVLMVTLAYRPDARQALLALDAGARAYVPAMAPLPLLAQVALVTANQGLWIWPELLPQMVGCACRMLQEKTPASNSVLSCLTERECDVALAVAAGKSNKEVANELGIAERTVKTHLGAVFRKLGLRDRMQLAVTLSGKSTEAL